MGAAFRAAWISIALAAGLGCKEEGPTCNQLCRRLAECKLEARQGAPILGEGKPPPDAACLERCAQGSDRFAACEAKPQDCEHLLQCSGALR